MNEGGRFTSSEKALNAEQAKVFKRRNLKQRIKFY